MSKLLDQEINDSPVLSGHNMYTLNPSLLKKGPRETDRVLTDIWQELYSRYFLMGRKPLSDKPRSN
jgi:hypothetical protein